VNYQEDGDGRNPTEEFNHVHIRDNKYNDVIFDDFDTAKLQKDLWCAPIFIPIQDEEYKNGKMYGVLLDRVEPNIFRRTGVFPIAIKPASTANTFHHIHDNMTTRHFDHQSAADHVPHNQPFRREISSQSGRQ
jgi:hypothetical protein